MFLFQKKGLGKKSKVKLRIYVLINWEKLLQYIYCPERKDNHTAKFGQLIEYKMRNTFLEKSYAI